MNDPVATAHNEDREGLSFIDVLLTLILTLLRV